MRVLLLANTEPGALSNGPAIILTNTFIELNARGDVDVSIGVLEAPGSPPADLDRSDRQSVLFRVPRDSGARSLMLRAGLGGPFNAPERRFLALAGRSSHNFDVVLWLGLSWDPVSLRLARACHCPVVHHPTDSITLSEVNRLKSPLNALRIAVAKTLERRLLESGYARSLYNSPADARFAGELSPLAPPSFATALPIGVDTEVFRPERGASVRNPVRVMFSGVMNYRPNVDAAVWLVRGILPLVSADVELMIVGRDPAAIVRELPETDPRVIVTGAVDDIAAEIRQSDIFVAPMISGGGISNKVMEAMACGLPVITTALVSDNFSDRPVSMIVAATATEIATAIDTLARDPSGRSDLGAVSRAYIESWSWRARTAKLISLLTETIAESRRAASKEPAQQAHSNF